MTIAWPIQTRTSRSDVPKAIDMDESLTPNSSNRLMSLDAYRGFIMLAMASGGLGFVKISEAMQEQGTSNGIWQILAHQFDHVQCTGCGFWDLSQLAFLFMVGVALAFSYAARHSRGESNARILLHAARRAGLLILIGVFLSSSGSNQTNWSFVNVLSQIGLGYLFLYAVLGRRPATQLAFVAMILGGYWLAFYLFPQPPDGFDWKTVGIGDDWDLMWESAAHWNKNYNFAASFDRWFLNLFPRPTPFSFNEGGYQTLNFVPSLATMIFGVMAGELLRSDRPGLSKRNLLFASGAACLLFGLTIDHTIWPERLMDVADAASRLVSGPATVTINPAWCLCPIVNRSWTPSSTVFSTGCVLAMLAVFYWLIDIEGYRRWSIPLVVVGANAVAAYCMSQLLKPW